MRLVSCIVLLSAIAALAAMDVSWSGKAQYRLRYEQTQTSATTDSLKYDLTHRYSWFLKGVVQAKDNLDFGIKVCNPSGNSTDAIVQNDSFPNAKNSVPVVLREFYFHWTAGIVSLYAVRIPVVASTILELSAYESKRYAEVGTDPWSTLTDNAQTGLLFDAVALKNNRISLRPSLLTAVALDPGASLIEPAKREKLDQWKMVLSVQTGLLNDRVVITPAGYFRTNIAQSGDGSESDHVMAGGLDITAKSAKMATVTAGVATGGYTNESQSGDTMISPIEPSGLLAKLGATVKPGFGVVNAAVTFGQWKNNVADPDLANRLVFGSLKYGIPIKNLTIEPWVRAWYGFDNQTDVTKFRIRGELSAIGTF